MLLQGEHFALEILEFLFGISSFGYISHRLNPALSLISYCLHHEEHEGKKSGDHRVPGAPLPVAYS
jgi:hypothetical protein